MFTTTTGMFIPDTQGLVVNAADFGFLPTSSATRNDTAIAAALAALPSSGPGVILIPVTGTATYFITKSIIIDRNNVALIAYGQRGGAATIAIDASADPTWALILGNTQTITGCLIDGLQFVGKNSGTSTGGGILWRAGFSKMRQCKIALFGGKGCSVIPFSGSLFEILFEDVDFVINGMNTSSHDDNLVLGVGIESCEFIRVISQGDIALTTTVHGITALGDYLKFVACHCYFCSSSGLFSSGVGNQVLGGEYETNGVYGIQSTGNQFTCTGNAGYGNGFADILISGTSSVNGAKLSSPNNLNIYCTSSGAVIGNNVLSGAANSIQLDAGATNVTVHDNSCAQAILTKSTNSQIHDNVASTITEQTGAQGNDIHDNKVTSAITLVGTTTAIRNNPGHNPIGNVAAPGFPASGTGVTNTSGYDVTAYVANGVNAITQVQIAGAGGSYVNTNFQIAASGWGAIRLPVGASVKFTYAGGAPAWTWFGD